MRGREFSILIVDENPGCRELCRGTLEPEGYSVVGAESGREALGIIRSEPIHLVVLELRLPDYSGVEVYHAIKDVRDAFVPCIFTTALEMTRQVMEEVLDEEAETILPKPVDVPRLVRAVERSIGKYYERKGLGRERLRWTRSAGHWEV